MIEQIDTLETIIADAKWHPEREDYAPFVPAWSRTDEKPLDIVYALDWECQSEYCELGSDNIGWAKWERLERGPHGDVKAYILCGHCGAEYAYDEEGNELDVD